MALEQGLESMEAQWSLEYAESRTVELEQRKGSTVVPGADKSKAHLAVVELEQNTERYQGAGWSRE